jgi:selenophosphate synthase
VYVIAKGKDHKQYEYGNKVSIVSTKDTNIIVVLITTYLGLWIMFSQERLLSDSNDIGGNKEYD